MAENVELVEKSFEIHSKQAVFENMLVRLKPHTELIWCFSLSPHLV